MSAERSRAASVITSWRESGYSGRDNGSCVGVADGFPGLVPVRDSKRPAGPVLMFRAAAWTAFVRTLDA